MAGRTSSVVSLAGPDGTDTLDLRTIQREEKNKNAKAQRILTDATSDVLRQFTSQQISGPV